jgi:hypothetical protein
MQSSSEEDGRISIGICHTTAHNKCYELMMSWLSSTHMCTVNLRLMDLRLMDLRLVNLRLVNLRL